MLLTVDNVASYLQLKKETVRRMVRRGELKGIRISKRGDMRFRKEDVEEFVNGAGLKKI